MRDPVKPNQLWRNRWQVIRTGRGAVIILCAHRHEWAARVCAGWRDLRTDATTFGCPVTTWHDYRPTPKRSQR